MAKTTIEWCDWTWNPVWGCSTGCRYCYAREVARRFAWEMCKRDKTIREQDLLDFVPTLIHSRLHAHIPDVRRVFVNSMSDIAYWARKWWGPIVERIENRPLTDFLFLTKDPRIYLEDWFPPHRNILRGVTDTGGGSTWKSPIGVDFVSAEPLHGVVHIGLYPRARWLIIGAETGNRKGKVEPRKEWLVETLEEADARRVPVFLKDSLRQYCEEWVIPFRTEFYI